MTRDELIKILRDEILIFDGAMGTELYSRHVFTNRCFEEICLSDPELVRSIHRDYLKAGAEVLTTNSFGACASALKKFGLADKVSVINQAAARLARECADEAEKKDGRRRFVAGSIAPPEEDAFNGSAGISEEAWCDMLAEQGKALLECGADFLIFETLPSPAIAQYARQAMAKLPADTAFVLSYAIQEDEFANGDSRDAYMEFEDDGLPLPAAVGLNCGVGPYAMLRACELLVKQCKLPVIVQPNAGSPLRVDNRQLYLCSPEYFTTYAVRYANLGVRGIGGCCGTNPSHIADMARSVKPLGRKREEIVVAGGNRPAVERQPEKPLAERSAWGRKLANGEWCVSMEMAPPPGWNCEKILNAAYRCKEEGIDVLNIPDGPRAAARLSAMVTAEIIQREVGIETVLHVCCRDRNYIGLQSDLLGCAAAGIHNLLFITGDPPKLGIYGFASGVFDTDSIGLTHLQKELNQGIDLGGLPINPPTAAVIGVGADPNAIDFDREIRRLRDKVEAGADYVCTQPIFDVRALEKFAKAIEDLHLPIVAGIWPMVNLRNALFMKKEVPGVVVPDWIIERMSQKETKEDQMKVGVEIAREAIAAIRGLVCGIQVSAPLGNVDAVMATIK